MIKATEHRHCVKGLFLCFTFFNRNPKPLCSAAVTLPDSRQCSVAEFPPAQSKLCCFQGPDILFAAIKSLSSCKALGCPGYSSHLPALQGRWQKLHRNIIFAASARCRRPLQFHFKCTFLHKELGGWMNRYLSLRFAAEIVSHLDVFEHWLLKWPLFLGSKI